MRAVASGTVPALSDFWQSRVRQHFRESYAGIPMTKFPEDLQTYEHLIWERRPEVILELGVFHGGSSLWFRDRLADLRRYHDGPKPRVIAIDLDIATARRNVEMLGGRAGEGIEFLEGDLAEPEFLKRLTEQIPAGAETLVIEDAAHDAATTQAALQGLAQLVRVGGYFVVEDTCVDVEALRGGEDWPRGCALALDQWLQTDPDGARFARRSDLQAYGVTCHPGGIIQRVSAS